MKRFLVLVFAILLSLTVLAQIKIPMGTPSEVKQFYKTTTCVVLKNDVFSEYNDAIKEAVNDFWDITPIEFISESDFNNLRNDAGKSFLMVFQVSFEGDKQNTLFDFLILTLGGKYKRVNDMPNLCAIPLCYNGEEDETSYIYKLGAMVKHCKSHLEICSKHPELTADKMYDFYRKNAESMETKNLCVLKEELSSELLDKSVFKSNYPYKFEFVSREQIQNLIKQNDEEAVITHIISPLATSSLSFCVKILIDVKSGTILYYDATNMKKKADGCISINDLKKISKK